MDWSMDIGCLSSVEAVTLGAELQVEAASGWYLLPDSQDKEAAEAAEATEPL